MKNNVPDTAGNTPELILRLSQHWLTEMICDHKRRTDQALCFCGWRSEIYYSVGGAVVAWAEHVSKLLRVAAPSQEAAPPKQLCLDCELPVDGPRGIDCNRTHIWKRSEVFTKLKIAEPAPSPATKDTPRTYWCCKADFGEHEPDCPNAAKSISQGPAREETLNKLAHNVVDEPMVSLGAAFDAGAQSRTPTNLESRTVAPQPDSAYKAAAKFVDLILGEAMEEWGGFDGDEIESAAIASGLIEQSPVTGSCGECCRCADYGFPTECDKLTISGKAVMNMAGKLVEGSESELAGAAALQLKTEDSNVSDMRESRSDTRDVAATGEIGMAFSGQDRSGHVQAGFQGTRIVVEGAAALPATPIEDIEVLEQAADYLRQLGGGPMEDRLRLLHERLAASVPAASSPTKDEHAVLQAALDWNEEYKFLNHLVGNPYWVAWANTLGMKGQYMPSPHTPKEMGHKPGDADYRKFAGEMASYDFEPSLEVDKDQIKPAAASSPEPNQGCEDCLWHECAGKTGGCHCQCHELPAPPVASQPAKEED